MLTRRGLIAATAAAPLAAPALISSARAQAQDYPRRPVQLVVAFPAGGGSVSW